MLPEVLQGVHLTISNQFLASQMHSINETTSTGSSGQDSF